MRRQTTEGTVEAAPEAEVGVEEAMDEEGERGGYLVKESSDSNSSDDSEEYLHEYFLGRSSPMSRIGHL